MEKTYNISLNISNKNGVFPLFRVVQGDNITRKIVASLYDENGDAYTPGTGVTAEYWSQKPDKTGTNHSATIADNVVTIVLTEQDTAAVGDVYATVKLVKDEEVLSAIPFRFKVEAFPLGANVESTSDYQTMVNATEAAEQATADAVEATEAAEQATEYATEAADTASNYNVNLLAEGYDATAIYVKGDYVIYQGALYRCLTDILTPEAWTASHWLAVELGADVEDAQRDATEGYSDTLTAGDLTSDEYAEDTEPYLFRRTFGGANNHEMDTLVGGTVAWNQLVKALDSTNWSNESGVTSSYSDGVVTISSTASNSGIRLSGGNNVGFVQGHKYLASVDFKSASAITVSAGSDSTVWSRKTFALTGDSNWHNFSYVETSAQTATKTFYIFGVASSYSNLMAQNPMLIDLTQMFGSTIADAIYAMEQAEAGSGVAWFRKYFPENYYAYDAGSLPSVEAVAHRMVGKNLLKITANSGTSNGISYVVHSDGSITLNGTASANTPITICARKVGMLKAGNYILNGNAAFNNNFVLQIFSYTQSNNIVRCVSNADYSFSIKENEDIGVFLYIFSGQALNNVTVYPMARYADVSDTTFKPYAQHTYKLDPSLTLRGIPKLTDGKLTYDGDTYEPSGQVVRRYCAVDLGSLTWINHSTVSNTFNGTVPSGQRPVSVSVSSARNAICARYPQYTSNTLANYDYGFAFNNAGNVLYVRDIRYSDKDAFQSAMFGVYLVYELATPTTETASPYEPTQVVYADGTEEYISNNIVPVGHVTKYPVSIKKALVDITKAPSTNGTYILKCVVSGGVASYSWVAE